MLSSTHPHATKSTYILVQKLGEIYITTLKSISNRQDVKRNIRSEEQE